MAATVYPLYVLETEGVNEAIRTVFGSSFLGTKLEADTRLALSIHGICLSVADHFSFKISLFSTSVSSFFFLILPVVLLPISLSFCLADVFFSLFLLLSIYL